MLYFTNQKYTLQILLKDQELSFHLFSYRQSFEKSFLYDTFPLNLKNLFPNIDLVFEHFREESNFTVDEKLGVISVGVNNPKQVTETIFLHLNYGNRG